METEALNNNAELADVTPEVLPNESDIIPAVEVNSENEAPSVNEETKLLERINALKEELDGLQKSKEEFLKAEAEKNELLLLFPDANTDSLPEEVLNDMSNGIPMAAAYALYERREFIKAEAASNHNSTTQKSGFGKIRTESASEYFSPSEVRSMSKSEVKKNYKRIIQSMKSWN